MELMTRKNRYFSMDTNVLYTILSVIIIGITYYLGFRHGKISGTESGRKIAVTDLLMTKDPEAWDKAHFLEVEDLERKKIATTKVVKVVKS